MRISVPDVIAESLISGMRKPKPRTGPGERTIHTLHRSIGRSKYDPKRVSVDGFVATPQSIVRPPQKLNPPKDRTEELAARTETQEQADHVRGLIAGAKSRWRQGLRHKKSEVGLEIHKMKRFLFSVEGRRK